MNLHRLALKQKTQAQAAVDSVLQELERRLYVAPFGNCHVNLAAAATRLCHAQSCGKCTPCRVGLSQLGNLMEDLLEGRGNEGTIKLLENTAQAIYESADCAIGFEAANTVLTSLRHFRDDYENHARGNGCLPDETGAVPCASRCPAHVDIPGYIALVAEGRYADAIRLIRKDNPFPVVCGLICEHPCEDRCRRNILDAAINIRGLKRYAADHCGVVPPPANAPATGKKVAVVGGGPAGLSAAHFLSLMGHKVTVLEKRKYLGGMLRYGIPSYRLPREELQRDIDCVLATGVEVQLGVDVGDGISMETLREEYDALFVSIGAHAEKRLGIPGENLRGVMSAVDLLRGLGDGGLPDFGGKRVVIIGGGNVAMDAARTSLRLGAAGVSVVYRRRREDMTALPEEVEGAVAEGCELVVLEAPVRMEGDSGDNLVALVTQPQAVGPVERGRPKPIKAKKPESAMPCDLAIVAIGQDIEAAKFVDFGMKARWNILAYEPDAAAPGLPGVFTGGDCATGPATVIRAIESGKVAAASIDKYLGYDHKISVEVDIPVPVPKRQPRWGRITMNERPADERKGDFAHLEFGMSAQEACLEADRCLRCDRYGCGVFRGGRISKW
ncbi:MAG: FAD-dependent oxidoreductase [Oscillospiraceae bacterium]|jgi:NADPH-dependent glutamate synthase beta subunit-like oxidoreductase|nr:FAD-dependent oxidoreductase [Oscillospiraceae bacterium]